MRSTALLSPPGAAGAPAAPTPAARPAVPLARWEPVLLLTLAMATEIAYVLGFVLPYGLAPSYTQPLLDLNRLNGHTPISANYFAVTWAVSFAAMYIAYRRCPAYPQRSYFLVLGGAALVFNCTLLLMYPTGAADLFDQIFRARELAVYGKNPFLYPPADPLFAQDAFRKYVGGWASTTSPYGPVWELLAAGTAWLAGADLWRALLFFKGLVILAYAGSAMLIYATLWRVRPGWAARGLLFFAWNPLILWETAGNGHNDMVMVFFTLLSLYLLARGPRAALWAPAALALGVLSKFVPVLLLPILLVAIWQERRPSGAAAWAVPVHEGWFRATTAVLLGAAGFLVIAIVLYAPFWQGPSTIGALTRRDLFTASIPEVIKDSMAGPQMPGDDGEAPAFVKNLLAGDQVLREAEAMDRVRTWSTWVVALTVFVSTAWLVLRTQAGDRQGILEGAFGACYNIFFIYLVFGTLWFQPWYQSWLIALTPLTARLPPVKRTLVMNAGGVANYFVWDFLVLWNMSWGIVVQWTAALAVNLPVLLYTVYQWLVPPSRARDEEPAAQDVSQHGDKGITSYDSE